MNEQIQNSPTPETGLNQQTTQILQGSNENKPSNIKSNLLILIGGILAILIVAIFLLFFFNPKKTVDTTGKNPGPPSRPTIVPSNDPAFKISPTPFASPTAAFVPDELIVQYNVNQTPEDLTSERKNQIQTIFDEAGVVAQEKLYNSNDNILRTYYMLKFKKGTNLENAKSILKTIPEIQNAEENTIITIEN